jgi:hypothetical protein
MPYITAGLLIFGAPLGILALYTIYKDMWKEIQKKEKKTNSTGNKESTHD